MKSFIIANGWIRFGNDPSREDRERRDHHSRQKSAPAQPQRAKITYEKLETILVPTLLMPGDQDLQTSPWIMRRQLAHIPGATFIVLPEAAHSINWEQPEAFNKNVLEFIEGY